ncbi:MAG: AraC family transcriptional regulator [Clostridiales bacterium]|nr:AraC family transcriptional regulator [Clostridiales bacterium]
MQNTHRLRKAVSGRRGIHREIKTYFMLLVLPLVLCIALFVGIRTVMRQLMEENMAHVMELFQSEIEAKRSETLLLADSLADTELFLQVQNGEVLSTAEGDAFVQVLSDYTDMGNGTRIEHFYLVSTISDQIYSDTGRFTTASLSAILSKVSITQEDLDAAVDAQRIQWHLLTQTGFAPCCVIPLSTEGGDNSGVLIVTLNMTNFLEVFTRLDASFCAMFNEDCYITSLLTNIPAGFDWYSEAEVSELVGLQVSCTYLEGESFTYLVALPRAEYNRPQKIIIIGFCVYALLFLVGGYCYLYHVSKRRYQQISSLIDALPQRPPEDTSYADIMQHVQDSLLDLRNQNENQKRTMQGELLRNLLYGHYGGEIPEPLLEPLHVGSMERYYVVSFYVQDFSNLTLQSAPKSDSLALLSVLFQSALEGLSKPDISVLSCGDFNSHTAVFSAALPHEAFKIRVIGICNDTAALLYQSYGITVYAMVSSMVCSVSALPEAFLETQKLNRFAHSVDSTSPLIVQEDLFGDRGNLLSGDFFKQEQILINTLLSGKFETIPSMVNAILEEHVAPLRKNYDVVHNRLQTIANLLAEGLIAAHIPGIDAVEASNRLQEADSIAALEEAAQVVFQRAAALSASNSEEDGIIAQALDYIQAHVGDRNLDVTAVCEYAGVGVKRLTRMFQRRFDMSVADYMNRCRIAAAKELLKNPKLTVAQVADRVGYNSSDTLARNFRKCEGVTPTEYRKLL